MDGQTQIYLSLWNQTKLVSQYSSGTGARLGPDASVATIGFLMGNGDDRESSLTVSLRTTRPSGRKVPRQCSGNVP